MERTNEALSYAIYMANTWNIHECALIFNGKDNVNEDDWMYSLGHHIWRKYEAYYDDYTFYGAVTKLLYELDENNVEKLLSRACELYNGRKNR